MALTDEQKKKLEAISASKLRRASSTASSTASGAVSDIAGRLAGRQSAVGKRVSDAQYARRMAADYDQFKAASVDSGSSGGNGSMVAGQGFTHYDSAPTTTRGKLSDFARNYAAVTQTDRALARGVPRPGATYTQMDIGEKISTAAGMSGIGKNIPTDKIGAALAVAGGAGKIPEEWQWEALAQEYETLAKKAQAEKPEESTVPKAWADLADTALSAYNALTLGRSDKTLDAVAPGIQEARRARDLAEAYDAQTDTHEDYSMMYRDMATLYALPEVVKGKVMDYVSSGDRILKSDARETRELAAQYFGDETTLERLRESYTRFQNMQNAQSRSENLTAWLDKLKAEHPYLYQLTMDNLELGGSLYSFAPRGLVESVGAVSQALGSGDSAYQTLDTNKGFYGAGDVVDLISARRAQDIEEALGGGTAGRVISQIYSGVKSGAENLGRISIGAATGMPGISLALAGTSAFSSGYREAASRGGTALEATLYGAASAALEVATEKVSLERFVTYNPDTLKKKVVDALLIQPGVEISEELASYFGGMIADGIIMGGRSEHKMDVLAYMQTGMSRDEAEQQVTKDIVQGAVETAFQTWVSSAGMAGVKYATSTGADVEPIITQPNAAATEAQQPVQTAATAAQPKSTSEGNTEYAQAGKQQTEGVETAEASDLALDDLPFTMDDGEPSRETVSRKATTTEVEAAAEALDHGYRTNFTRNYDAYSGESDLKTYLRAYSAFTTAGETGMNYHEFAQRYPAFAAAIQPAAAQDAYSIGQSKLKTVERKVEQSGRSVVYDGDYQALTKTQKTNFEALETVAQALGVKIYVYSSKADKGGSPVLADGVYAPNGWYDSTDGSIHIDLNSGADSTGTMLFTASHELTHYIRNHSEESYKKLADFLAEEYGTDMESMIARQMELGERNGRTLSREQALEEVVADSMEMMLTDKDVVEKLQRLKNRDRGLWQRIKDYFRDLAKKIRRVYKELDPDSEEGRRVKALGDKVDELKSLFVEGLEAARAGAQKENAGEAETRRSDRAYLDAVSRGDMETAQKMVDEKAAQADNRYSYAGRAAKTADTGRLAQAEEMEKQGRSNEEIRQETGWFRGRDGKWRFEIDDSQMIVDPKGTVQGKKDKTGAYLEFIRLREKLRSGRDWTEEGRLASMFMGYEHAVSVGKADSAQANYAELMESSRGDMFRQYLKARQKAGELADSSVRNPAIVGTLADFVSHPALFENYPFLRDVPVAIMELGTGCAGASENGQVWLNWALFAPEGTWVENYADVMDTAIEDVLVHEIQHIVQVYEDFTPGASEEYWEAEMKKRGEGSDMDKVFALYMNTSGEIEARDVAKRRLLTAEERKKTPPDLGDEKTVFADSSISLSMDISEYPYDMQTIIQEYIGGVDGQILEFVHEVRSGQAWKGKKLGVGNAGAKMAKDLRRIVGVEVSSEVPILLNADAVTHIDKRHGARGTADTSMRNAEDIARIGYILRNYDTIDETKLSRGQRNRDGTHAKSVVLTKRINGTYYVVEAVPDTGKIWITSAYITKKGTSQVRDAKAPRFTAETESASVPDTRVPQTSQTVKQESTGEIKFSERRAPTGAEKQQRRTIENLRKLLKVQGKITEGKVPDRNTVSKAASFLIKESGVTGRIWELTDILEAYCEELFKGVTQGNIDRIMELDERAVDWIQDHKKQSKDPYAQEILGELKGRVVKLNFPQWEEVKARFGSAGAFRKAIGSAVSIRNEGGTPLDVFFAEMHESYPDYFRDDMGDAGLGVELADIIDRLKNTESVDALEERYYEEEIRAELSQKIQSAVAAYVKPLKTVADKFAAKAAEREKAFAAEKKAMADKFATKAAAKEKAFAEEKKSMEAKREAEKQKRARTEARSKIVRTVQALNDYLLNSDKGRHVPLHMQKPVAELLSALNLDRSAIDERITKLRGELRDPRNMGNERKLMAITDKIRYWESKRHGGVQGKLEELSRAYRKISQSTDPAIAAGFDENVQKKLDEIVETVGDTPLGAMNEEQLELVYNALTMTLTRIRNANKLFRQEKTASVDAMSAEVSRELRPAAAEAKTMRRRSAVFLSRQHWNNYKPIYAFRRIGSSALTRLYESVRAGEDVAAVDYHEAHVKWSELRQKYHTSEWEMDRSYPFTDRDGNKFNLTLDEIFTVYAHVQRGAQAIDHYTGGGFVLDKGISRKVDGKTGEFVDVNYNAYGLDMGILADIIGTLTDEQKAWADEAQEYLSEVMGAKGNEVSMSLYGVRLFGEEHYFPLTSVHEYLAKAKDQEKGESKIKNGGFTKKTKQEAKNPIVLSPFSEVWAGHVVEMARYHGLVLPMEDFYRVYGNSHIADGNAQAVQALLGTAYGPAAVEYIDQLLKDINGDTRTDPREIPMIKAINLYKQASVLANLSVVLQQRTSQARAYAVIEQKYFTPKGAVGKEYQRLRDDMMTFAPIARIKSIGSFDSGVGRTAKDYILKADYDSFGQRVKAVFTDSDYRSEVLGKAAILADEQTWVAIWRGALNKALAEGDYSPGSEEHKNAAAKIFTECIELTQVYDSVFSRSATARSKGAGARMATAFMTEPTTLVNMVEDAIRQFGRGDKRYGRRALGAATASIIINAAVQAMAYAARDEDEDQTYWEKYMESLTGALLDAFNPMGYFPYLRDIMSMFNGYKAERADMSIVADLIDAYNKVTGDSDSVTGYDRFIAAAGAIGNVFGLPIKALERDASGIWQTISNEIRLKGKSEETIGAVASIRQGLPGWLDKIVPDPSTVGGIEKAYKSGDYDWEKAEKSLQRLRQLDGEPAYTENELYWIRRKWDTGLTQTDHIDIAVLSGDTDAMLAAADELTTHSDNPPKNPLQSAIVRVYKNSLKPEDERNVLYNGKTITRDEAHKLLTEVAGMDGHEAFTELEKAEYATQNGSTAGFSVYSGVYDAMISGTGIDSAVSALVAEGFLEREVLSRVKAEITSAYKSGELSRDQVTKILGAYYDVTEQKDLYAYFDEAEYETAYGESYTVYRDVYAAVDTGGDITGAVRHLVSNGYDESQVYGEAASRVRELYRNGEISIGEAATRLKKYSRTTETLSEAEKKAYKKQYGQVPKDGEMRYLTENELYWKLDELQWGQENDGTYSKYHYWYDAIEADDATAKLKETVKYYEEHGVSKSTLRAQITRQYKDAYTDAWLSGDTDRETELKSAILRALVALGYTRSQGYDILKEWKDEARSDGR